MRATPPTREPLRADRESRRTRVHKKRTPGWNGRRRTDRPHLEQRHLPPSEPGWRNSIRGTGCPGISRPRQRSEAALDRPFRLEADAPPASALSRRPGPPYQGSRLHARPSALQPTGRPCFGCGRSRSLLPLSLGGGVHRLAVAVVSCGAGRLRVRLSDSRPLCSNAPRAPHPPGMYGQVAQAARAHRRGARPKRGPGFRRPRTGARVRSRHARRSVHGPTRRGIRVGGPVVKGNKGGSIAGATCAASAQAACDVPRPTVPLRRKST